MMDIEPTQLPGLGIAGKLLRSCGPNHETDIIMPMLRFSASGRDSMLIQIKNGRLHM